MIWTRRSLTNYLIFEYLQLCTLTSFWFDRPIINITGCLILLKSLFLVVSVLVDIRYVSSFHRIEICLTTLGAFWHSQPQMELLLLFLSSLNMILRVLVNQDVNHVGLFSVNPCFLHAKLKLRYSWWGKEMLEKEEKAKKCQSLHEVQFRFFKRFIFNRIDKPVL